MRGGQARHVDGLPVMRDHPLHEFDIMHGVERASGDRDVTMIAHVHPRHGPLSLSRGGGQGKGQSEGQECGSDDAREIHRSAGLTVCGKNWRKSSCIHWGRGPYPVNPTSTIRGITSGAPPARPASFLSYDPPNPG